MLHPDARISATTKVQIQSHPGERWTVSCCALNKRDGRSLTPAPGVAHHLPTDTRKTDPDLATVVAAWPGLPEAIKAGIQAMVKASRQ